MKSLLIAVVSCNKPEYAEKRKAQRETWASGAEPLVYGASQEWEVEVAFFSGRSDDPIRRTVRLDCDDSYAGLPEKTMAVIEEFLGTGFDYLLKVDDDAYVQIDRLVALLESYGDNVPDYAGRLRGPSGDKPAPYASGFCYLLSRRAAQIILDNPMPETAEDRMVGNILHAHGIECTPWWEQFVITTSNKNATSGAEGPRKGNSVIACAEYSPDSMRLVHQEWLTTPSGTDARMLPTGTAFDRVCVIIKTLLRDGLLLKAIRSIEQNMPGARMVIVDDGRDSAVKITEYARLRSIGHSCIWLPFDSGFGAKSNAAIPYCDREYALIASDDFLFDEEAADGVLKMIRVLDGDKDFDVASGRVDNVPYEGYLVYEQREDGWFDVKAERLDTATGAFFMMGDIRYWAVGHTVNYNLCRRSILDHVRWDERFKIGGDHARFYEQVKQAGGAIAYVEGVNIRQMTPEPRDVHEHYGMCRGRARLALPTLYREQRWRSFTHFDGHVETLEQVDEWAERYQRPHGAIAPPRVSDIRGTRTKKA